MRVTRSNGSVFWKSALLGCTIAVILCQFALEAGVYDDEIVWEDEFGDGVQIEDGSSLTGEETGVTVSFNTEVFSDGEGGSFLPYGGASEDYFQVEHGQLGAHSGHLGLGFDNASYDPDDYLRLSLDFSSPVHDLEFSLLDVDTGLWDDGVVVTFNGGQNVVGYGLYSFVSGGWRRSVMEDNEANWEGFEGINEEEWWGWWDKSAEADHDGGNIKFDFSNTAVTSIEIEYFSTDDLSGNPAAQRIGVSDMSYSIVPEPSLAVLSILVAVFFLQLRRPGSRR
jgi:hypothetical protein